MYTGNARTRGRVWVGSRECCGAQTMHNRPGVRKARRVPAASRLRAGAPRAAGHGAQPRLAAGSVGRPAWQAPFCSPFAFSLSSSHDSEQETGPGRNRQCTFRALNVHWLKRGLPGERSGCRGRARSGRSATAARSGPATQRAERSGLA